MQSPSLIESPLEIQSKNVVVNVNVNKEANDEHENEDGCQIKSNCVNHKYKILAVISGTSLVSGVTALILHFINC